MERALKVWVSGRGGTIGSRKMGSGDAAAPLRREGAGAPLRKKFQHVERALKVWFFEREGHDLEQKNGKWRCNRTLEKKKCSHTILEQGRGPFRLKKEKVQPHHSRARRGDHSN